MDTTQFFLSIILTITTILLIIIGVQLIFILKELKKTIKKTGKFVIDSEIVTASDKKDHHQKKQFVEKKHSSFYSLLQKIKILSPPNPKTKKFIKSI